MFHTPVHVHVFYPVVVARDGSPFLVFCVEWINGEHNILSNVFILAQQFLERRMYINLSLIHCDLNSYTAIVMQFANDVHYAGCNRHSKSTHVFISFPCLQ